MHVHVESSEGDAKFWLEPVIALADYKNLSAKQLRAIQTEIEGRQHELKKSWKQHFSS